jgi:hypothetical protein
MSLRELARMNDVTNHSLVMYQANKNEWARKRQDFRARADDMTLDRMADVEARRRAREMQVRDNAIEAIDEAITKLRLDMKRTVKRERDGEWVDEPVLTLRPADIAVLIDRFQTIIGRPSNITEERNLGLSLSATGLAPEVLRGIVEATRGIADASGPASSPIPRLDRAREN